MRILPIVSLLLAVFSMNVYAVEPVDEQQVMVYYSIPLGADNPQDSKHQFGLRFDQVMHDPRQDVHISTLEGKTAAMDFRMDYDGIKSLKIHGVDYASYLIARAAEGEKAPVKTETATGATTEATPAATENKSAEGAKPAETAEAPKQEKGPIQQVIGDLPFGVFIGVIIGIGILSGVGG